MDLLNLREFVGGALQEKVNTAMQKILENMRAPEPWWRLTETWWIKKPARLLRIR